MKRKHKQRNRFGRTREGQRKWNRMRGTGPRLTMLRRRRKVRLKMQRDSRRRNRT